MQQLTPSVRIDKWLWAARFFKTRSLAQQAVEGGRVKLNGERTKPAKDLRVGDQLVMHIGEHEWVIEVRSLSDRRGSAEVARRLWLETDESRARREQMVEARRMQANPAVNIKGRPTKRDRRALDRFIRGRS
jgi:ribosome-associated heat shock protein Hsp15